MRGLEHVVGPPKAVEFVTGKYGVLLINMGGPVSREKIGDYLFRLFSDPLIINAPRFLRRGIARLIAARRKSKSRARYDLIGGKSPLGEETEAQVRKLEELLKVPVAFAMRYSEPFIAEVRKQLEERGAKRLIVLPLYPQYSRATTMSALQDFLENRDQDIPYRFIQQHYNYGPYITAMRSILTDSLQQAKPGYKTAVIFVAHSIPMKQVRAGDPYVDHIKSTVSLMAAEKPIPYPYTIAYQSRIGPIKWQGPSMELILEQMVDEEITQLVVQPISFTAENLETLYDLDIEFKKKCAKVGITNYIRVPAPGINPVYIKAMAALIQDEINHWEAPNVAQ